jgi:hypothetical protein
MPYRRCRFSAGLLAGVLLLWLGATAWGQQTSASLSGVVKDSQGSSVPGAQVVIVNQLQGATARELKTGEDGVFNAPSLNPATYTITVTARGFKTFEQKDLKLYANDRIALPPIVLEVGALAESVVVTASTVQLQTETAERSGIITGSQTANLALNGRNYLSLTALVPGVVNTANNQVAGPGGIGSIFANGQHGDMNSVSLDGATNMDTGANGTQLTSLNIDAVAEFRVLTGSQSAEFGRIPGAMINVVTKSGTRDFHGVGYWVHRHEDLNATNWRNNHFNLPKNRYRYNYEGYNIGGPLYIPGKFNTGKQKLFFFWAQEWQRQFIPTSNVNITVPTAAERKGDFSLTHDGSGLPVVIKDPANGGTPFPGNMIPQNRWSGDGQKFLNYLPLPNVSGQNSYNFTSSQSAAYPRGQQLGRIDWNINDRWKAFFRVNVDQDRQGMPYGIWGTTINVPGLPMAYSQPAQTGVVNLTTIISPTLTNEFIFGPGRNRLTILPTTDGFDRSNLTISTPMPYNANVLNIIPGFTYGGVPNGPNVSIIDAPFYNVNDNFDFIDNISKVAGTHQLRAGFYIQRSRKDQTSENPIGGTFGFGRDSANPLDSNWAFSNALLGNFQTFQQANAFLNSRLRFTDVEWYLQDAWAVRPNLSLSYGVRFVVQQPQYDVANRGAAFNPSYYDPKQAAVLYQRVKNAAGAVVAQNPLTGQLMPAVYIGALVPGVGVWQGGAYVNGIARAGNGYFRGQIMNRGVQYSPRIGIVWRFSPKMNLRVGGGVFYDRIWGTGGVSNPPAVISPTVYYSSFADLASGSTGGAMFPSGLSTFAPDGHLPVTYNWNASIQRELDGHTTIDVAYVGSMARHMVYTMNINAVPYGADWLPQNQDSTLGTPKTDGSTALPTNYLRPFQGYGDINMQQFGGNSNYNSLQVSLNRRVAKGLQGGVTYTWSHALGEVSATSDSLNPLNYRLANYGPLSYDRRHNMVINYMYDVPGIARQNFLDNRVGRAVFNNWHITGLTSFVSGAPGSIGYSINGVSNLNNLITGSQSFGPRVVLTGNPNLDKSGRSINAFINTGVFAPALVGSTGMDSAQRVYFGPGINNWDVTIFKNFPFTKEGGRLLHFRCEMFNAPNHPQFSGINSSVAFNSAGQVTNLPIAVTKGGSPNGGTEGFGAINGARDPRIIQLSVKLYF